MFPLTGSPKRTATLAASILLVCASTVSGSSGERSGDLRSRFVTDAAALAKLEILAGRFDAADEILRGAHAAHAAITELAGAEEARTGAARIAIGRARLHHYRGFVVGPTTEATVELTRSAVRSAEESGDDALAAEAHDLLALVLFGKNFRATDHAESRALLAKALEVRRRLEDRRGQAETLFHLGLTWEHPKDPTAEDYARARELYRESLALAYAGGFDYEASYGERHLAGQADEVGDLVGARAGFERSLALRRKAGATLVLSPAMTALADVLVKLGETERARHLYEEAVAVARSFGATRFQEEPEAALARMQEPAPAP